MVVGQAMLFFSQNNSLRQQAKLYFALFICLGAMQINQYTNHQLKRLIAQTIVYTIIYLVAESIKRNVSY
jgi:hypothetical protein